MDRCLGPYALALVVFLAGLGCDRKAEKTAPTPPSSRVLVSDVLPLLGLPHDEVLKRVGAHRYTSTQKIVLKVGDVTETFEEEHTLEVSQDGSYRAASFNSKDQGREIVFVGGDLFVRPRYGIFVRRKPEGGEAARLRAETFGTLSSLVEVFGRFVQVRDEGSSQWEGRSGKKFSLGKETRPKVAPVEEEPARRWRSTVEVGQLTGEVFVDTEKQVVLHCLLDVIYTFKRDETPVSGELHLRASLMPGGEVTIPMPEHVPKPQRVRYHTEEQELLRGLRAPGARRP